MQKVEENCTGLYMMEIVKNLLIMINSLVAQGGGLTTDTNSPSRTFQCKADLNQRLVSIVLPGIVHGKFALKSNLFKSRSLYIGSHDVMTSTPSLLVIEWLLSPGLLLSAGNSSKFLGLILKMISLQREDISSFMDFVHSVLKKLLVMNDNVSLSKQPQLLKSATDVWCTLVEEIVKFVQSEGSINQGNAAVHDFSALYAVLLFPSQNFFVDLQLIYRCSEPWSSLFYEACQQAALIPTTTEQYLCEQVCSRLVSLTKRSGGSKQLASVYYFLTLIVKVAKGKFNSVKRLRLIQSHVSVTVKELYSSAFDQEVVFNQVVSCVEQCLHPNTVSVEVIGNVSPTICALLQSRVTTYDPVDKLCNLLNAVKQASMYLNHHASSNAAVTSLVQGIIQAGKSHPCQKVRSTIRELCDAFEEKRTSDKETKTVIGTVLSPTNRSPKTLISVSPKSASKKIAAIQMSPSNLSPSNTKRKLQTTVCGADGKFVRIETPPKKIILTEHQKEVRRERRQDIPALYQDLSQDTQSLSQDSSQDCVALPVTPSKKTKSSMPVDEDAVMDVVDAEASVQVVCSTFQSPQRTESPRSSSKFTQSLEPKSDARSFTPPAGFVLPSVNDCTPRSENVDVTLKEPPGPKLDSGKTKGPVDGPSSVKSDSANSTSRRGALTRSSSNTDLRTRSGKVLKRNSVAPELDKVKRKPLPSRKSLPNNSSDDLKKNMVETVVIESDNTDTESISSTASDVNSSNARRSGTASRRRRSQKSLFQDSELDGASIVEIKDPITQDDCAKVPCCESSKLLKSVEPKTLIAEQQINNDKQNQPPRKKVGGKILTRSRSNSSLDEAIGLVKKQTESSTGDTSSKSGSPVESSSKMKDFNKVNSNTSPRKKSSSFEVTSGMSGANIDSLEISSGKKMNGENLTINTSSSNGTLVEKSSDFDQLDQRKGQQGSSVKSNDSSKKEGQVKSVSPNTEKLRGKAQSMSSSGADESGADPEHGTEESQEIIASSQEPLANLLKPCLVSLQQFDCSNVQQITQFDDVIVEKGPDDKSPYKVRSKDMQVSPTTSSSTRRALDLDTEKTSSCGGKMGTVALTHISSPVKSYKGAAPTVPDEVQPLSADILGETANDEGSGNDAFKIIPSNMQKETETAPTNNQESKNDSKPDWMHTKKNSSPSKVLPKMGSTSARRHAFMKSVRDGETSSSPPKGVDNSPMSSPLQSKRISKSVESGNTTPIINRSSRAAQILGT